MYNLSQSREIMLHLIWGDIIIQRSHAEIDRLLSKPGGKFIEWLSSLESIETKIQRKIVLGITPFKTTSYTILPPQIHVSILLNIIYNLKNIFIFLIILHCYLHVGCFAIDSVRNVQLLRKFKIAFTDLAPAIYDYFTNPYVSMWPRLNGSALRSDGLFSDERTLTKQNENFSHNNCNGKRQICHCVYRSVPDPKNLITVWLEHIICFC